VDEEGARRGREKGREGEGLGAGREPEASGVLEVEA
jgi:hypothetical protein